MDLAALLHSIFLLPALAGMVVLDAPFPVVPSEPALMSAYGLAFGAHAWLLIAGIFVAAFVGAVTGDLLMWRLGRGTRRMPVENALTRWVALNIERRPGVVIVGARFLPGGRLVSTLAAGRYGMSFARFLPWSLLTSAAWAGYMLLLGLLLAPLIDGNPLRGLVAGLATALLVGGLVQLGRRSATALRSARRPVPRHPAPRPAVPPVVRLDGVATREPALTNRI